MQKEGEPEGGPGAEPGGGEGEPEEGRVWPSDTGHRGGHHAPGERSPPGTWGAPPGCTAASQQLGSCTIAAHLIIK